MSGVPAMILKQVGNDTDAAIKGLKHAAELELLGSHQLAAVIRNTSANMIIATRLSQLLYNVDNHLRMMNFIGAGVVTLLTLILWKVWH